VIVFHSVKYEAIPSGTFMASSFSVPHIYSISDPDVQRIKEVYEKNAQMIVNRVEDIFKEQGLDVETRLIFDETPGSYIKKTVKHENIDLVIVGSKGLHSLTEEFLLGSVAEKVLRHTPCDVLVIR